MSTGSMTTSAYNYQSKQGLDSERNGALGVGAMALHGVQVLSPFDHSATATPATTYERMGLSREACR